MKHRIKESILNDHSNNSSLQKKNLSIQLNKLKNLTCESSSLFGLGKGQTLEASD